MAEAVEDIAALWAVRLDARPLEQEEESELESWLAASDKHRGALLRAQATLAYLDRAASLAAGSSAASATRPAAPRFGRRTFIAATASAAAAAGIGAIAIIRPWQQRIDTAIGEVRRVPLQDGSVATLNTDTRLRVAFDSSERVVDLADGEAWFEVAHDAAKPFIVEAGEVRVRAVGTAFSVRRRGDGADVLVTEGRVLAWRAGDDERPVGVDAGYRIYLGARAPAKPVKAGAEIERALAWRSGEIAFDGESLGEAVEEFNRYNRRKLVVEDPALAREPLVGFFRANEPESFARAVSPMIGAAAIEEDDRIVIARR
jgi:transmembrane sensor